MVNDTTLAIVAIVAAVGLLGVIAIESISMSQQEAEAVKSIIGQCASTLKNSSASFCHNLG
jgi:hypothetical protein